MGNHQGMMVIQLSSINNFSVSQARIWLVSLMQPIGEISVSQRRGVITLLTKEDSNLLLLSNWRPITLLNTDYKIASKVLVKRIESVVPSIIHPDQTGFMKGRYIGQNIKLINDIIQQTELQRSLGYCYFWIFKKHSIPQNGHLSNIPSICSTLVTASKNGSLRQILILRAVS